MPPKRNLIVRNATKEDVAQIFSLVMRVYPELPAYPEPMIRAQITNFPEGHFVATLNDEIVGYCATIRVAEGKALSPHTWREITGNGYGSTHDGKGLFLYGYEVCVDPKIRGYRIGQRFYDERRKLCQYLRLKGIVFAGRIPNIKKRLKTFQTVENYIDAVKKKKIRDPVLSFQLRNGFEILGVFSDYLPQDLDSLGYGIHLIWKNPQYEERQESTGKSFGRSASTSTVRIGVVQYGQRRISSFDQFSKIVEYFVDVVADYRGDFVLFPELFTLQLLSIENEPLRPAEAIAKVLQYSEQIHRLFENLSLKFNINIIAGSHPKKVSGNIQNVCGIYLRDGSFHEQAKIHPTPNEKYWWNIEGGNEVLAIQTDCGPIGVLVCYDSEFPELARHLADQGARILFVPFLTDERQSYLRVRYCSQARAVENQMYVALAGNCGNLPNVNNMDIHYAQSSIFTPCDFPFARDGIAADTTPNVETVAFADLRLDDLIEARNAGTVQNLKDRRHDLYSVRWNHKNKNLPKAK